MSQRRATRRCWFRFHEGAFEEGEAVPVLKLEELSWPQLEALDRAHTVIFVPVSPIEEHGPHLPLGTDMYTCRALTEALAMQLEERHPEMTAVLLPMTPLGSSTVPYLGSIGSPPRMVRDMLMYVGRAFARDGFRFVVAVSGHMGLSHLLAMETAARKVSRRYGITMMAPVANVWRRMVRDKALVEQCAELPEPITGKALEVLLKGHHAGALETSLMLHLHPDLVQPGYRHLRHIGPGQFLRWRGWTRERWAGYIGEPALARADFGQIILATIARLAADLVARTVKGDAPAFDEVFPLSREMGRMVLRGSLLVGAVGMAGALAGFWFRVWRPAGRLRVTHKD